MPSRDLDQYMQSIQAILQVVQRPYPLISRTLLVRYMCVSFVFWWPCFECSDRLLLLLMLRCLSKPFPPLSLVLSHSFGLHPSQSLMFRRKLSRKRSHCPLSVANSSKWELLSYRTQSLLFLHFYPGWATVTNPSTSTCLHSSPSLGASKRRKMPLQMLASQY